MLMEVPVKRQTKAVPVEAPKARARVRHVLIEWHGMITRAEIVGYADQELTLHTRGFVPPAGARVSVRRALSLRTNGAPKSIALWLVDRVTVLRGNSYELVLVRGPGARPHADQNQR